MIRALAVLTLVFLSSCTVTHFNKYPDGSYSASNYSFGMDRKDITIIGPDGTTGIIGDSNGSEVTGNVLETIKELKSPL